MQCPSCGYHNLPGADCCEQCDTNLMHEDLPLDRIRSAIERSLGEDRVGTLNLVEAVSVPEDTPLDAAIQTMRNRMFGCVLVTDPDGRLCGIFTERDVLYKLPGGGSRGPIDRLCITANDGGRPASPANRRRAGTPDEDPVLPGRHRLRGEPREKHSGAQLFITVNRTPTSIS